MQNKALMQALDKAKIKAKMIANKINRRLGKLDHHAKAIESYEEVDCEDAEIVIAAIGISARAAGRAQRQARQKGIKAGLFRPITLWPFPEAAFQKAAKKAKHIIVPEMNAGQLIVEVDRLAKARTKVIGINRIDGEVISPAAILNKIEEVA